MNITRKAFIQTSAMITAGAFASTLFDFKKKSPMLSFSTLGCPDWSFQQVVDFAVQHHYSGIELRGIKREMYLPKCPEFSNENMAATLQTMKEKKLKFVDLGSSCTLHFPEGEQREKNLAEGKAFIDLAKKIGCPCVRVFPNELPKDKDKSETMALIVKGLTELGDYAKGSNVKVLMETHGDLVWINDIEKIMKDASHPQVGLVWDITNMWTVTKESPAEAYRVLNKFIHHTHIKDAKLVDGKPQYTRLGQGEVPLTEAFNALQNGDYKGYYSFEWEKLWHPELEDPETALADYPLAVMKYLRK